MKTLWGMLVVLILVAFFSLGRSEEDLELAKGDFLKKCKQSPENLSANRKIKLTKGKNLRTDSFCETLWTDFIKAYESGNWEADFFNKHKDLRFHALANRALFWSGTKAVAHNNKWFPGKTTLEDTPGGKLFDGLRGLDFVVPKLLTLSEDDKKKTPAQLAEMALKTPRNAFGFWSGASKRFAAGTSGTVWVLLGGTDPFRTGSIFRATELSNILQKPEITKVVIEVMKPSEADTKSNYFKQDTWIRSLAQLKEAVEFADKNLPKEVSLLEVKIPDPIAKYCKENIDNTYCKSLVPAGCVVKANKCKDWSMKLQKLANRIKVAKA